ncbi:lipopolysaccharide biosynthesis protein [Microbacterium terregens]|uniref:Lipopolysaccharide biosynthesis protein n=1 Tax=Microbacterium terregens TaxID=69363 RepID=A0ABV5T3D0_9MICO
MIRRYAISFGSRFGGAIFQAILFIAITRVLRPVDMGVFTTANAATLFVFGIIDFGMGTRFLRLKADPDARGYLGFSLLSRGAAVALLALLLASAWAIFGVGYNSQLVLAACLLAVGESFGESAVVVWQGRLQSGRAAMALLARRGASLIPIFVLPTADGVLIAGAVAAVSGVAFYLIAVAARAGRALPIKVALVRNAPFALASAGPQISQLDSVVISLTSSVTLTGFYAPAARLTNPINVAITSMMQVFVPELARTPDRNSRLNVFRRARRLVLVIALSVSSLALLSPQITLILFGPEYTQSTPMIAAVFVGAGLSGIAQIHLAWFYGTTTPLRVPLIMIFCSVAGLAAMAILGPIFGIVGLAVSFVLMHGAVAASLVLAWRKDVH